MRVLILGGDGYLGWPTAMHLSHHGYDVTVLDSYFARKVVEELDLPYLFPVRTCTSGRPHGAPGRVAKSAP